MIVYKSQIIYNISKVKIVINVNIKSYAVYSIPLFQGHHDNSAFLALDETLEFNEAVKNALALTNEEDTLIVVTADHSHAFSMAGYPSMDNDIFGEWIK